ncbi:hypothetical protein FHW13_003331 [Dokdonella fugitiva]|nr:hypothetical protein [Dokdonella fugitiva]
MALGIAGLIGLQGLALAAGGIHAKSGSQMPAPHAQPNGKSLRKGVVKVAATGHSPEGSPFQLTVGLTPGGDGTTCGTDSSVVVNVGDTIDFCYTVTNDSTTAMAYSTLVDSVDGPIFTNMPTAIPAGGGTFVFHRSVTATVSNTYSGTWTSRDLLPGYTPDDTVAAAFVDITSTGTGLGLADDGEVGITIPFSFSFYGVPSNQLCIANNGVIVFGVSTCDVAFSNTALPGTFGGAAIAPFWDDFYQPSGNVYWAVQGTSPNRTVIIEWDRAHYNVGAETSGRAQVEAILGEDGSISFQYQNTAFGTPSSFDHGISATIGLQNADASLVNQYSFNTVLPHPDPSSIVWTAGAATVLTATAGVSLDVGAPVIGVTPTEITAGAPSGSSTPVTQNLSIANTGDRDLTWSITEAAGDGAAPAPAPQVPSNAQKPDRVVTLTGADREDLYAQRKLAASQGHAVQADIRQGAPRVSRDVVTPSGVDCGPSVQGMIVHDDGTAENGYSGNPGTVSSFIAVDRFTPSSYPATFTTVCTSFVTNAGATSVSYEVVVYDDDGAGGGPGTELGAVATTGTVSGAIGSLVFNSVDISALGLNIPSGSVYIGVRFNPQTQTGTYIASDESGTNPPAGGYVSFDTGSGPAFAPTADSFEDYTALFVRAIEGTSGCVEPQDVPWLSVAPASGTVTTGAAPATAVVTMDPSGLSDGLYTANVCVASNDPAHAMTPVPVSFTVGDVDPAATVAPGSFMFSLETNHTDSDTLTITNSGDVGSHLTYTITEASGACTTPSDQPWLSASPTSGSVPVGTPASVTVSVDSTGLANGSYSGNLCLTTNDAAQPTITVPVTLEVTPPDLIFRDGFDGAVEFTQPIQDPSFEETTDDASSNPYWDGSDSNAPGDTPFWSNLARTGTFAAWGGGWRGPGTQEWSQTVTIASGGPRWLNYWRNVTLAPNGTATLAIAVDGTVVSTTDIVANGTDADWTNVSVDLGAYADNGAHEVKFTYTATGSEDGNCFVDDITIDEQQGSTR